MKVHFTRAKVYWGWEARFANAVHGRTSEAWMAVRTMLWGAYVYSTPSSMATGTYASILRVMSEAQLSSIAMITGLVYLCALHVNGAQRAITTVLRTVASGMIMSLWVFFLFGFFIAAPSSTAVPTYLLFVAMPSVLEFVKAATDAMRVARGVREVRVWLE
jgi:hypothetical protein